MQLKHIDLSDEPIFGLTIAEINENIWKNKKTKQLNIKDLIL